MKKLNSIKNLIKQTVKQIQDVIEDGYKKILTKVMKAETLIGDNRGMGTVEIILIIVVLIGLVIIFKTQITSVVQNIFSKITTKTGAI